MLVATLTVRGREGHRTDLSETTLSGIALPSAPKSRAVDLVERYAHAACACRDATCAVAASDAFARSLGDKSSPMGDDDDSLAIEIALVRGSRCTELLVDAESSKH
jgi:hypothetical protein